MKKTNMNSLSLITASSVVALLVTLAGCGDSSKSGGASTRSAGDDHGHDHGPSGHDHAAAPAKQPGTPHGGTPVQVGDHGYHLELVPDPIEGKMLAYVLDGHMEKSVNVAGAPFELVAKVGGAGGQEQRFTFNPVTNAPNATADKTSVFSASGPGMNTLTNFEGVIPKITLDGKSFENVTFSYPRGSRHAH